MSLNAEDVPLFYNLVGRIKVDEEHLVYLKEEVELISDFFLSQLTSIDYALIFSK